MTDEYTPSLDEVRADYVRDHTHGYDEFQGRYTLTAMQEFYGEQFDRMIAALMERTRADEREKAAQIVDEFPTRSVWGPYIAARIRARGEGEVVSEHRMVPGSHERPAGAECVCGKEWSRWLEECEAQHAARIRAQGKEQS